jgi:hypothetical protein
MKRMKPMKLMKKSLIRFGFGDEVFLGQKSPIRRSSSCASLAS